MFFTGVANMPPTSFTVFVEMFNIIPLYPITIDDYIYISIYRKHLMLLSSIDSATITRYIHIYIYTQLIIIVYIRFGFRCTQGARVPPAAVPNLSGTALSHCRFRGHRVRFAGRFCLEAVVLGRPLPLIFLEFILWFSPGCSG